ncbi:hypothetical protein [Actinomadura algeriensis]|uniref:Uncharacterized protein n=1 Tax=Actinomadura algeriensis TaxID=1679523 RepID=A0ABR9JNL3_9ACTN|nr:hypothetical protein [Actinomadura algeriensis]MBE1532166.1 hypothetical protein [Actinomadura algeriensis]
MNRSAKGLSRVLVLAASAALAVSAAAVPAHATGAVVRPVPPVPVHGQGPTTEQALIANVGKTLANLRDGLTKGKTEDKAEGQTEGESVEVLKTEEAPAGKTN